MLITWPFYKDAWNAPRLEWYHGIQPVLMALARFMCFPAAEEHQSIQRSIQREQMTIDKKPEEKQSFITEARRAQIVEAAIATLDEIGYVNASLAQIAKRAGISTALISYHFQDKNDLMDQTLMTLLAGATSYVLERTKAASAARDKLHAYIESRLAYQGTHPKHYIALVEIVFNARTPDNVPYYKLSDDEEELLILDLQQILRDGQSAGEFREFNVHVMANVISGAIGEYLLNPNLSARVDLESYGIELVKIFDRAILHEHK